jgi:hypothetical protein
MKCPIASCVLCKQVGHGRFQTPETGLGYFKRWLWPDDDYWRCVANEMR